MILQVTAIVCENGAPEERGPVYVTRRSPANAPGSTRSRVWPNAETAMRDWSYGLPI